MGTTTTPTPDSFLPLKADVFTILLALAEGESHGYGIIKAADARHGRRGQLQPGALYRLLAQLLDAGLVEALPRHEAPPGSDERRRYYRLTRLGRDVAAAEARRMADLVSRSRAQRLLEEG